MPQRKPGIVYDLGNGKFGIAYHEDQKNELIAKGKVLVHVFYDRLCTEQVMDMYQKPYRTLKEAGKIKPIGRSD